MLKNYFIIAWRNLLRNKMLSCINIVGLALGMACSLLIGTYLWHEFSFDQYNEHVESIYRVVTRFKTADSDDGVATSGFDVGPRLQGAYPEIVNSVRFKSMAVATIQLGDEVVNQEDVYFADSSVFDVFSYRLVSGSKAALAAPNSVVLTQRLAQKYFGTSEPLGKTLKINDQPYTVTGVLENLPANTDLKFSALLSWKDDPSTEEDVFDTSCYTYLLFQKPQNAEDFGKKLADFDRNQVKPRVKALGYDFQVEHQVQALADLHFVEGWYDDNPKGNRTYLAIFLVVAAFILFVAYINFVNLHTAQATQRRKEAGVRTVVGARKEQLIGQFMGEAWLIIGIGASFSLLLILLFRSLFEQFTGISLAFPGWQFVGLGVGVIGLASIVAGLYPALFLATKPTSFIIKGKSGTTAKQYVRKALVVVQFTISVVLIVSTLVITRQTDFLRSKDPGFSKEQVLVIGVPPEETIAQKMRALKATLAKDSRIEAVSLGLSPISEDGLVGVIKESAGQKSERFVKFARVDEDYLDLLKIKLIAGRNLKPAQSAEKELEVIVNESFVKWMGWPQDKVVGHVIPLVAPPDEILATQRVAGVVADYHFESLHKPVEPLMLYYQSDRPLNVLIRVKPERLAVIKSIWKNLIPDYPFEAQFLDVAFDQQYQSEEKAKTLLSWLTGLIILIACLGLFGLAALTAEQRTKEIGIRKVLGASVNSIVALLSKDFLKLVVIAILVASPIAWYATDVWLQGFAYRIDTGWWVFVLAGLLAVGIALFTVSFQSVKAAVRNPVESLRSE
ncbi:ABC transporter permease [Salmonirosea aquatica]|uniref:FtsX-like permease family protein n=1 Tax=Salmonirosea aquatica TaxID=2654236 RepID=A0A7C9FRU6_9BACT|nr:FtsX-like permease family protein [Cytophagaceae bacterium SJW1-29]